jgi:hypothetical protein
MAALDQRALAEGVEHRAAQRLGSVDHHQGGAIGVQPAFDQILQQRLAGGCVLGRSFARQRVVVNENGRRRSITKQEAMVKHLVNKALSGDRRLIQLMLEEIRLLENRAASSATAVIDEGDQQVMRQLQNSFLQPVGHCLKQKSVPDANRGFGAIEHPPALLEGGGVESAELGEFVRQVLSSRL